MPVKRQTLWRQAKMSGYVQGYTPGGKRALRVPVAGKIVAIHAKPGQWVQQGDFGYKKIAHPRMRVGNGSKIQL